MQLSGATAGRYPQRNSSTALRTSLKAGKRQGATLRRWVLQHGSARPLSVRFAPQKALHDRAIFIDNAKAWTLTQSLKDFAKRSPAEIVRADDTAALKISAYEAIWAGARTIV